MNKLLLLLALNCLTASATTINIKYSETEEDNKVGFYDKTERVSTEGNPGITLGEARRYAFEYAAKIIESQVYSEADILIKVNYSSGTPYSSYTAYTISNTYTHTETSNYDEYGILKDGVLYSEIIKRMLQHDTREMWKNFYDAEMVFKYTGGDYEINAVNSAGPGFVNLALHELVHALGFGRMSCFGDCTEEQANQVSQLSGNIYTTAPYDSPWDDLSLSDKNLVAVEGNKVFYYGNQAMADYLFDNLTTGFNDYGVQLHSDPLSDGGLSPQALGHLSANVTPVQLMTSRVGNTLSLGASAYIICDIGWCRNDGFVTDFKMSSLYNDRLTPDTLTFLKYNFSNDNNTDLDNVFIEFNVYDASVINVNQLDPKCTMTDAIITCNIGDMASFEVQSIDLPFKAPIGTYRIMANIYSNSHVVDLDGSNNVDVQIVQVGELAFPDITMSSEFIYEEELNVSFKPIFETNEAISFSWTVTDYNDTTFEISENSSTGEVTFTTPSIDEDTLINMTLNAIFDNRTASFDVTINITAKSDDNSGTDTGSGTDNGSTSNSTDNTQQSLTNDNDESGGGSFNIIFLFITLIFSLKRYVQISKD
jgi:hypothetical protein